MKRTMIWLTALFLVLALFLSACSGGSSDAAPDGSGAGGPSDTSSDTGSSDTGSTSSDDQGDDAPPASEAPAADAAGEVVPADVPVMPGAYNLDVIHEGSQVNYTVDGDIEAVMSFYQEELAALGWSETRAPDSAVGAIGSMTRKNDAGDLISLNMSYNQVNGATTIAIAISRQD